MRPALANKMSYGRHQQPPHETPRPRSPDFRGAHSRELAHVQEGDEGLFEDEQNYSQQPARRRAGPQEYTQAYREFEAAEEEPAKRRQAGPFILLGALLAAGVIAAGLVYFLLLSGEPWHAVTGGSAARCRARAAGEDPASGR